MGALADYGQRLSSVSREPYQDAFLIGDLVTRHITVLSGAPKSGKSLLAVGMVEALLEGSESFLGLPVHRRLKHVVFGLTDDGAIPELRERFEGSPSMQSVTVFPVRPTDDREGYWSELRDDLIAGGADLFVYDNVIGGLAIGEDVSESTTATVVLQNFRIISEAGVPVLVVTHTPKGNNEGTSRADAPIGGRALAGGARGIIVLRYAEDKGRRIQTATNRARKDLNLAVHVQITGDGERPVWSIRKEAAGRPEKKRTKAVLDRVGEVIADICEHQTSEESMSALARTYGPQHDDTTADLRKKLSSAIEWDPEAGRYVRKSQQIPAR